MPPLRTPRKAAALALAFAATLMAAPSSAGAAASYPLTFSIPEMLLAAPANTTSPPPGANDWSCKPSAAHPEPVVLVHGLLANMFDNWEGMSPVIADNGFCVFAFTYGLAPGESAFGGLIAMEQSAPQLAAFVDRVLAVTGASKVDLVGHSEGTVMPRYYMEFLGGAAKVDRYVMLTPIWHGTEVLGAGALQHLGNTYNPQFTTVAENLFGQLTICASCPEFITGSPFLQNLDAHGTALAGVLYTDIVTRYDELVQPYTNGILGAPNVTNIVLQDQCPLDYSEHFTVAFDPTAAQDLLNALDPAHARPVPCALVLPGIGAPLPPPVGLSGYDTAPAGPRPATGFGARQCAALSNLSFRLHHPRASGSPGPPR